MINDKPDFLVSIRCMTYNHAPYIEDAMNGFCIQQTTFPFVTIIVDDASTDGEPEVIISYLKAHFDMSQARQWETDDAWFTYAKHSENNNCYFAVVLLKYNFWQAKKSKEPLIKEWADTKYVALCEGDDYWISNEKLQRQIIVLENNPTIMLVHTGHKCIDENGSSIKSSIQDGYRKTALNKNNLLSLLKGNFIFTQTVCIRKKVIDSDLFLRCPSRVDYALFLCSAFLGELYYIDEDMAIYRSLSMGMVRSNAKLVAKLCTNVWNYCAIAFFQQKHKRLSFVEEKEIAFFILKELENRNKLPLSFYKEIKSHYLCWLFFLFKIALLLKKFSINLRTYC